MATVKSMSSLVNVGPVVLSAALPRNLRRMTCRSTQGGKSREVAARLEARHIERDALGDDEAPGFAALVAAEVAHLQRFRFTAPRQAATWLTSLHR
jgi:hypothetical protein